MILLNKKFLYVVFKLYFSHNKKRKKKYKNFAHKDFGLKILLKI